MTKTPKLLCALFAAMLSLAAVRPSHATEYLYATTDTSDTVVRVTLSGQVSSSITVAGNVTHATADSSGNVYVALPLNNEIEKIAPDGTVSVYATFPAGTDPNGLAFDQNGNLYVLGASNDTVIKIAPDGTQTTVLSTGIPELANIAVDQNNNLFFDSNDTGSIYELSATGNYSVFASTPGDAYGQGLAFDASGNLFFSVVTHSGPQIQEYTPTGDESLYTTVSDSVNPWDLAFDSDGNLYTADANAGTIDLVTPTGVSVFASVDPGYYTYGLVDVSQSVPEPSSLLLMVPALAMFARCHRNKRRA